MEQIKTGLASKCRPQKWEDVVGNEASIKSFRNLVEQKTGAKAFLILGHTGCGKTTIARIACKETLKCEAMKIKEIDCSTDGKIDTPREVKREVSYSSGGKNRAFIMDEVHNLSKKAQEGMLKILEECKPTDYFFLCTTDASKFEKTFLNRLQKVIINQLSTKEIMEVLDNAIDTEDLDIDDEVLEEIADISEGSARQALNYLESVVGLDVDEALEKLEKDNEMGTAEVTEGALFDLMKAVLFKDIDFNAIVERLKYIKDEGKEQPESIRLAFVNYANGTRMRGGNYPERVDEVLDNFLYDYEGIYHKGQAWPFLVDKFFKVCQ